MVSAKRPVQDHHLPYGAPEDGSDAPAWVIGQPPLHVAEPSGAAPANGAASSRKWRIALYSNDAMGLGHVRRNLLLAQTLSGPPLHAIVLMVAGAHQASSFVMPPGVDCLTLPALRRANDGQHQARRLGISLSELIVLRATAIRASLDAFDPDVLIVGNVPRGAVGELDPTLEHLRARGRTRCVLGLRDVLEDPETVRAEWTAFGNEQAICDYYDAVWVYGDPAVYDLVREYSFPPEVAAKVRYLGYLDQCARLKFAPAEASGGGRRSGDPLAGLDLPPGDLILCVVGGGQDGEGLADAFAQAELPPNTNGVILTGPFMPPDAQQRLRSRVGLDPRRRVLEFVPEPTLLLARADRVIAMGGYNTVLELLSFEKRALVVPRVGPRPEQWIRAERLRDLGLLDVLHPDEVRPEALTEWLSREMGPRPRVRDRIDLNGLERLAGLLEELLLGLPRNGYEREERRHADQ
jgi:predicted glycosyltransferase